VTDAPTGPPVVAEHPTVAALQRGGELRVHVRSGLMSTALSRFGMQLVMFGSTILLARLLSPDDYGLYAIVATVVGFVTLFIDAGFAAAVIQAPVLTQKLATTAFYANAAMAVLTAVVVVILARPVAALVDEPDLVTLMPLAAVTMLLSVNAINVAFMRRSMRFELENRLSLAGQVLSTGTTVVCALLGFGPYALIAGPIADRLLMLVGSTSLVRWHPTGRPDRRAFDQLWLFTRGYTGYAVLDYWARNTDKVILARLAPVAELGLYSRALNLATLTTRQGVEVLTRVFFPTFSKLADEPVRLASSWLLLLRAAALVSLPVCVGLASVSDLFVLVAFGPRWSGVSPLLLLLAAACFFTTLTAMANPVYQALGRTGQQFKIGLVTSAMMIGAMLAGALLDGAIGLAWGMLAVGPVVFAVTVGPVMQLVRVPLRAVLLLLLRSLVLGTAMAVSTLLTRSLVHETPVWLQLASCVVVGGAVWATGGYLLERDLMERVLRRGGRGRVG